MRRVVFLALALDACTSFQGPPVAESVFKAPYDRLGACVYERVSSGGIVGLSYVDLRASNTIVISSMNQSVAVWEARFTVEGSGATRVGVRSMPTAYGPDYYARQIFDHARACAG